LPRAAIDLTGCDSIAPRAGLLRSIHSPICAMSDVWVVLVLLVCFQNLVVDVWNAQSSRLELLRKKIKTRGVSAVR
jgi:hypothetical protein